MLQIYDEDIHLSKNKQKEHQLYLSEYFISNPVPADTGYLVTDPAFTAGCCGVLTSWMVSIQAPGKISLQIWRPEGSKFKLVGENSFSFNSGKHLLYSVV